MARTFLARNRRRRVQGKAYTSESLKGLNQDDRVTFMCWKAVDHAWPTPFEYKIIGGDSLLLATDGLLEDTSSERIVTVCRDEVASNVPRGLIELVRYTSGALPDDVTVIFASSDSRWTS